VMPIYKILFWMSPIYLVLVPVLIYIYVYDLLFLVITAVILMYLAIIVPFLYVKMVLKIAGKY
jgi:hypothetical protein